MPKALNLSGGLFGAIEVIERTEKTKAGQWKYTCRCFCGRLFEARTGDLRNGHTTSCGCKAERKGEYHPNFKHGYSNKNHPMKKEYENEMFLLRTYGLTKEGLSVMLSEQGDACKICGHKFGQADRDMHVDHDHATGKVRGLLCYHCNRGLGSFKDSVESLSNAIAYLGGSNVSPSPAR